MAILCPSIKAAYTPIPKAACTTIKTVIYKVNNENSGGARFLPSSLAQRVPFRRKSIHSREGYRTLSNVAAGQPPEDYTWFSVIRNPAFRVISAWRNKANEAVFRAQNEEIDIIDYGLKLNPTLPEFIWNYHAYRTISKPIRRHTEPFAFYLGQSLSRYDKLFPVEDLNLFQEWFEARLHRRIPMPKINASNKPIRMNLCKKDIEELLILLRDDFDLLHAHYDVSATFDRLAEQCA